MMTPDRQTLQEVQKLLKAARPEQIKRLMRDILKADNDDFNQTGTA